MEELSFKNEPMYAVVMSLSQTVTCGHFYNTALKAQHCT